MEIEALISLFERDLNRVIKEIELYQVESNIWRIEKNVSNSAGNLVLHLVGNLNTYIGKEIGGTDYVRNRDLEFSLKDVPRTELIDKLNHTLTVVKKSLRLLYGQDLGKEYPLLVLSEKTSFSYFLMHLLGHLNYHLGQINYHRRLIEI